MKKEELKAKLDEAGDACAVSTSLCDKRQRLSQCGQCFMMLSLCVIFFAPP